ncbi:unnamed protein product, partial [Mesorhabditis belari]|uniref:Uncharacterized protein n=1 Tax=Mesorhabditis belari TaxID=2138241 RepID=A0AAF3E9Q8_9BILA
MWVGLFVGLFVGLLAPWCIHAQINPNYPQFNNNFNNDFQQQPQIVPNRMPVDGAFAGGDYRQYTLFEGPMVIYGEQWGDSVVADDTQFGRLIPLHTFFPFYGGKYNYTVISTNGYIGFGYFSEQTNTFKVGQEVDWPNHADPAVMGPYLCKQRIGGSNEQRSKVFYRIEKRAGTSAQQNNYGAERLHCRGLSHYFCDGMSENFLNGVERALQDGVAGGSVFRADAALVVTWKDMMPNVGDEESRATYQLVWATDAQGHLAYAMTNYHTLNFDAADMNGNTRTGRCQAVFNGGNHTGLVQLDLSDLTKMRPSSLAERSAVPHVTRGRYLHRVDDVVRHAGCSNKTGGTSPLLVYPNIVSMLGQVTVEVNALCLDPAVTYILMIESRQSAPCTVFSPSIARCKLPKILDWGTKTVYFQPQGGQAQDEKAFVGFIYFVPPTLNPTRLDIGNVAQWYKNPVPTTQVIKWFPRNFTIDLSTDILGTQSRNYMDNSIYSVPLGLYVFGYREAQDETKKKFIPQHRVLAKLASFSNRADEEYRWKSQIEKLDLNRVEKWFLTEWELKEELYTYRFGYLKLAPQPLNEQSATKNGHGVHPEIPEGIVSAPISLHWLWTTFDNKERAKLKNDGRSEKDANLEFVKEKSREMCKDWYEEDGALNNFIRETETNSSCPCKEEQASMDYGRFMPHPRCSRLFRDVTCTETLGSSNCYMSAQNVRGSQVRVTSEGVQENSYMTHYGQTCCYDDKGYLMQSSYQPVLKIDDTTPYSPGFPTRAYEHGTYPDIGMFEVPGLSTFHHDILPYYLCCKYTDFRCQLFYWRRPSSACQAYEAAVSGSVMGGGHFSTLDGRQFVFNDPGVYTLLHAHATQSTPEVQIQVRQERYPDRSVNFGRVEYNQDRVVPSNVTVITGVALQSDGADTVHVILRKDTYRMRYRTTVIVGNVVRYFDNMILQKFRGVTIYANNVHKGQSEVYVVLDNAQIGVRIRESYAMDMDITRQFYESPGLLDVTVSVPPQYKVRASNHLHNNERARVNGLLMPYPEQNMGVYPNVLQWSDVNNEGLRSTLIQQYKIGNLDYEYQPDHHVEDLFVASPQNEQLFNAFPDHFLKSPTYTVSSKYRNPVAYPFIPMNEQNYRDFINFCRKTHLSQMQPDWEKALLKRCPQVLAMETACQNDVACLFDTTTLQSKILGEDSKSNQINYQLQRSQSMQHFNSCGAMNIEYPEYLIKGPSSAAKAYVEGDTLQFSCFATHTIYGDTEFTCEKHTIAHDSRHGDGQHAYMMKWTSGGQPWCRHKAKDNVLKWLQWSAIVFAILLVLILVFAACWVCKQQRKQASLSEEREMQPLKERKNKPLFIKTPLAQQFVRRTETPQHKELSVQRFEKEPSRRSSQSSLHHTMDEPRNDFSLGRSTTSPPQYNEYKPRSGGNVGGPASSSRAKPREEISV